MSARKPIKLHGCLGSALDCEACQDLYWPEGSHQPAVPNEPDRALVTIGGRTRTMAAWARYFGVPVRTARKRIASGWDPVRAVAEHYT